jgi:hypothetical protein
MIDMSNNIQALPIHHDYQVILRLLRKVEENEEDYDLDDDEEISFWD